MMGDVTLETKVRSLLQLNDATDTSFLINLRKVCELVIYRTSCLYYG
jgi:hypothetical protein